MQLCAVCDQQAPKYRCPACQVRYCSVGCCKKHKEECKPQARPATAAAPEGRQPCAGAEEPLAVHDLLNEDDQTDAVPLPSLKQLGESEALRDLLLNPHLRRLLAAVDGAQNKAEAMKTAMQEPLFVEFADQCLKVVEPADTEIY
ncbi:zinc finger HIT domain-containing protein 3 [Denticeps clupeoides]|uniref:Zinc finger HIT domain-containing protein 3 n=1 Tax=Denticeps clupeoides TaxID=299321 RepID=A0AAY4EP47_9TELE|nr:zinc finger HIT domain-containing protein 3 [Denticeps clupeoides]